MSIKISLANTFYIGIVKIKKHLQKEIKLINKSDCCRIRIYFATIFFIL